MGTPAQDALSEGFDALTDVFDPDGSWTFGSATFAGVLTPLFSPFLPHAPRMVGEGDRQFELDVRTADLPDPAPARGDSLTSNGASYRISRVLDQNPQTGRSKFAVTIE